MNRSRNLANYFAVLSTCALLSGTGITYGQDHSHMSAADHQTSGSFSSEMMQSMKKMNQDMMAHSMTGQPDLDFVNMMIPHHQGAVDMAKIQLKYGKNEALRKMAEEVIASQEKEITLMKQIREELLKAKSK